MYVVRGFSWGGTIQDFANSPKSDLDHKNEGLSNAVSSAVHFSFLYATLRRSCEANGSLYMQVIIFDDFQIWEGRCSPDQEPFASEFLPITPTWPTLRTNFDEKTTLAGQVVFDKAFVGGGCGEFEITNRGAQVCENFELEINIRPSWGTILTKDGLPSLTGLALLEQDAQAGVCFSSITTAMQEV